MPVNANEVRVGAFFITATDQLRKVTQIDDLGGGAKKVHYVAKSGNIPNRKFDFIHTKSNPPGLEEFMGACDHLLSSQEIADFRARNIILPSE